MISIDIFVPEHGGDPLSAGKSRPGLGWSVLDVMKALEVERAAKMDGLWFTMVYPFSYHGLPLKIASNLWFSGCTTIFFKNILTDPSHAHRKKHEMLLNAMPSCTRCQDTSGVQHSQTSRLHVHQCP